MRLDPGGDRRHAEQQGAAGRADRFGKRPAVDLAVPRLDRARSAGGLPRCPPRPGGAEAPAHKSDANDARSLAQIVRTGWYREVAVKSLDGQLVRALITARQRVAWRRKRQKWPHPLRLVRRRGRIRASKIEHSVEDLGGDGDLGVPSLVAVEAQPVTDNLFPARELALDTSPLMIAAVTLVARQSGVLGQFW